MPKREAKPIVTTIENKTSVNEMITNSKFLKRTDNRMICPENTSAMRIRAFLSKIE
jgi:hypothetical protein